jgi:hypothetical protein
MVSTIPRKLKFLWPGRVAVQDCTCSGLRKIELGSHLVPFRPLDGGV